MKYMVMECHPGYAVVLADDGRFLKVANMRYEVGQTVTEVTALDLPEIHRQPVRRRWLPALVAVAACLVLMVASIFFTGQTPYASVYMAINPEVRIDVNRNDIVVGVEGINTDGKDLLTGYDFGKKNLDLVMDELVDRAIDMGYLHEGGKITLSLDADENWVVTHSEHLTTQLTEHLSQKFTVSIEVSLPGPSDEYGDSDYGDSDYGETTGSGSTHPTSVTDTDYDPEDDGQTNHGEPTDDDDTPYQDPTDGATPYEGPSDDEDTPYEEPSDDGDTDYDDPG